ncbi:MAG: hypothetical protein JF603_08700 [Acidobacteria bacterium]|nr:hypothetical protein [Acidobacteriota bacterium]
MIAWAAAGMVGVFAAIALLARATGQSWSTAAGVASLPTLFGGWYFGALLPLSRQDFSHPGEAPRAAATASSAVAADAPPSAVGRTVAVDDGSDAVAPAA